MIDWFRQYKPDWLYKLLPYLYIGAGILTIVFLRNWLAFIPGVTLVLAGWSVYSMRQQARSSAIAERAGRRAKTTPCKTSGDSPKPSPLFQITLGAANECGHPIIDAQHRDLCATANLLLAAVMGNDPLINVRTLFDDLEKDLEIHFRTEEDILNRVDPKFAAEHKLLHDDLLARARVIIGHCRAGTVDAKEIVDFVAYEFVTKHIGKEDKRYFSKIRA